MESQSSQFFQHITRQGFGVVRVHSHRRVDLGVRLGQSHRRLAGSQARSNVDDGLYPGGGCSFYDALSIASEPAGIEVSVGVNQFHPFIRYQSVANAAIQARIACWFRRSTVGRIRSSFEVILWRLQPS